MKRAFIAFLATIIAINPASAGPSSPFEWGKQGTPQAFTRLAMYARCVVHSERRPTAKFLASNYPSKDGHAKAYDLISAASMCIDRYLKLDFQFMRGALIEALYADDIINHSGKPLVALGTSAGEEGSVTPPTELARCIVQREAEKAAQVVRTPIASAQQTDAMRALEPSLGQCAHETKSPATIPELLRFQIAEQLYRRAGEGRTVFIDQK